VEPNSARMVLSISEGRIEIEGSEDFVEKHLEVFKEHIEKSLQRMVDGAKAPAPAAANSVNKPTPAGAGTGESTGLTGYDHLFAKVDDKIQVLKTLPGANKKEKTQSAALLVAFAHRAVGVEPVSFEAIRDACKADGSYDSSNFAGYIKDDTANFVVTGKAPSYSLTLTTPGKTKALALANSLNLPDVPPT
jgi:hypothetical protein